jgi:hypothetical protein
LWVPEVIGRRRKSNHLNGVEIRITNRVKKLSMDIFQEVAGHLSITTTRKYYLKEAEDDLRAALRAACENFDPALGQG